MGNLTVGELRLLLDGVSDDTMVAVQTPNDPREAFPLDSLPFGQCGDFLVLCHSGNDAVIIDEDE